MGMAGVVVDGMGDMGAVIVIGVIMAHVISKLVSIWKKLVLKKKNKNKTKCQPCMGMASIVIDSVSDVATIVVIGMPCIVSI